MTEDDLSIVVLAGGVGSRLRSVTHDLPKVLAPIQAVPFLKILYDEISDSSFKHVFFSLGYGAIEVENVIKNWRGSLDYTILKEREKLGTGGAIKFVLKSSNLNGKFMLTNGDSIVDGGMQQFRKNLFAMGALNACKFQDISFLAIVKVNDSSRYGTIEFEEDGFGIRGFIEKTGKTVPGYIYAGFSLLNSGQILTHVDDIFSLETDFLPSLISQNKLKGIVLDGWFCDIGIPEDYIRFCSWYQNRTKNERNN